MLIAPLVPRSESRTCRPGTRSRGRSASTPGNRCTPATSSGIPVSPGVDLVGGHDQHARGTGVDAQVAPLARVDVDHQRPPGQHGSALGQRTGRRSAGHGRTPPTPMGQAMRRPRLRTRRRRRSRRARSLSSRCWVRYPGTLERAAWRQCIEGDHPVAAHRAPSMTMLAAMTLPASDGQIGGRHHHHPVAGTVDRPGVPHRLVDEDEPPVTHPVGGWGPRTRGA